MHDKYTTIYTDILHIPTRFISFPHHFPYHFSPQHFNKKFAIFFRLSPTNRISTIITTINVQKKNVTLIEISLYAQITSTKS